MKTLILILFTIFGLYWLSSSFKYSWQDEVSAHIKEKSVSTQALKSLRISGETLQSPSELQRLYKTNEYRPFWSFEGRLSNQGRKVLEVIRTAGNDGLVPELYHARSLELWLSTLGKSIGTKNPDSLALFDILLTDAFVSYSIHQYAGAVYDDGMNVHRAAHLKKVSLRDSLTGAIKDNRVESVMKGFINPTPPYAKLKQKLLFYKRIAQHGGYPAIPDFQSDKDISVETFKKLCERLSATGQLPAGYFTDHYSPFLRLGIRQFQFTHGLDTTGLLNRETIKQLNIPAQTRIRQIELNMERCRWLPHTPVKEFVLVNIPGFFMEAHENYQVKLHMRAIVGKEFTQTPQFYASMKHIVINPYWDVPYSIASKEILPILKKDPEYIHRNHMKVYTSDSVEVNPHEVSWDNYSSEYFPYKIRQVPGPWNSLGQIKFLFPNRYSAYLHGTPHPELFNENVRMFSHGCMRIEDPVGFAAYLLRNEPGWNKASVETIIESQEETWIKMPYSLPVFVTYSTCWVDDNGTLHFRNDVYGHDNTLAREFYEPADVLSLN